MDFWKKRYFKRGFQRNCEKIIKIVIVFFTQSPYICIQKAKQDNRIYKFAGFWSGVARLFILKILLKDIIWFYLVRAEVVHSALPLFLWRIYRTTSSIFQICFLPPKSAPSPLVLPKKLPSVISSETVIATRRSICSFLFRSHSIFCWKQEGGLCLAIKEDTRTLSLFFKNYINFKNLIFKQCGMLHTFDVIAVGGFVS